MLALPPLSYPSLINRFRSIKRPVCGKGGRWRNSRVGSKSGWLGGLTGSFLFKSKLLSSYLLQVCVCVCVCVYVCMYVCIYIYIYIYIAPGIPIPFLVGLTSLFRDGNLLTALVLKPLPISRCSDLRLVITDIPDNGPFSLPCAQKWP